MTTSTLDKKLKGLKKKARKLAEEDRREAAAKEARRRWEDMRSTLMSTADHVGDVAEEQWEHARDTAGPAVKRLRQKAVEAWDTDLDWLRTEISDVSGDIGRSLMNVGSDVKDATRAEANRIIQAIHDSAEEVREEERKRRVRALIGWTAFGMVAGAVLALQFGPKATEESIIAQQAAENPFAEESFAEGSADGADATADDEAVQETPSL